MLARHDTDIVSLIFGLLFVAGAGLWGLGDQVSLPGRGWHLPVLLILVGLIGLIGSRRRSTRQEPPERR